MGLRRPRLSVDVDGHITATILDNGDVYIDQYGGATVSRELVITAIEDRIDSLNATTQQLHLVRDLLRLEGEMEKQNGVKRVYNNDGDSVPIVEHGPCADCDRPTELIASQWGKTRHGDLVCMRCENIREHEYGIPPSE